jgi:type IV pilus assembly protein PilA
MRVLRPRLGVESGFSLIEVLVVTLIVALLAAIAIPSFLGQSDKASDSGAKSAVRTAATAIESFNTDAGTYAGANRAALVEIEPTLGELGPGDLTVAPNGTRGYRVSVRKGGNRFTIEKQDGVSSRTCTVPGKGGCPAGGSW